MAPAPQQQAVRCRLSVMSLRSSAGHAFGWLATPAPELVWGMELALQQQARNARVACTGAVEEWWSMGDVV